MTPTQLESLWKEFDYKFMPLFVASLDGKDRTYKLIGDEVWQWFESKLEKVEVIRGLENFKITMEEIEKARDEATGKDWYVQDDELVVKKGSYVIYRIDLKSNKLEGKDEIK